MRFSPDLSRQGCGYLMIDDHVVLRYCTPPWNLNNAACRVQTRVTVCLSRAAWFAWCVHIFCACLSEGPESNYGIHSGNGKYTVCRTLQPARRQRLEICNQPEFPIRFRQGICCAGEADAKLKLRGRKSWPAAITISLVLLHCTVFVLFCSDYEQVYEL